VTLERFVGPSFDYAVECFPEVEKSILLIAAFTRTEHKSVTHCQIQWRFVIFSAAANGARDNV